MRDSSEFSDFVQNVWAELPPLSNFIHRPKFFRSARKGLGSSLALQCYARLVSSGFPFKVAQEITREDKGKLIILFIPIFALFLLNKIVCSL